MRRDARKNNINNNEMDSKFIKYASIGVAILAIILISMIIYSRSLNSETKQGTLSSKDLTNIVNKTTESTESASTEMGKSVNESKNELTNETTTNSTTNETSTNTSSNTTNTSSTNKILTTASTTKPSNTTTPSNTSQTNNTNTSQTQNETKPTPKEPTFIKPVEGEIVKDFAKDNLIFSETLQEWTVHTGIDIKADKTTVVKASEAGTIKSIKNDPRYGLTIVIEHENGYQTIYSNLLTSEFVVEGEKVEQGQSIGTVGNTAAFEIADEPHLHFEILKESIQQDPNIYIKQ